jgi:amino acid adenylation domain-containing protein
MKLGDFGLLQDDAERGDLRALLTKFNDTGSAYPRATVHALFAERARLTPDAIAAEQDDASITYGELDRASNRLARALIAHGVTSESFVGVLLDDAVGLTTALLGILKAGAAYCPLDSDTPYDRARYVLCETGARVLVSSKSFMRRINRLQWDCPALDAIVCLDSDSALNEPEVTGEKMRREVWDFVGQTAFDDISGGGWQSSFTGEWLSREVMDDYGDNIRIKLAPQLTPASRVLEIGCASGISMFRLAPLVAEYVGTDLSPDILAWTRKEAERLGVRNIQLQPYPAHEVDRVTSGPFDIVIINSVLQCFSGHNYLREVIRKAVALLKDNGLIFLGNVFDQDLKDGFVDALHEYRREHAGPGIRTKTDYSEELFINRAFLADLRHELPAIRSIDYSPLVGTHESELSQYSFDAVLRIDKHASAAPLQARHKHQLDRRALAAMPDAPLAEAASPDSLAYVIYTSGTSGRPKGVLVPHRAIVRLVTNTNFIALDASTRVLMTGAVAFDASTFEIWGALLNGGTLIRPPDLALLDAVDMKRRIRESRATTMWLTASLFNQFVDIDVDIFAGLKHLLVGGERLSPSHVNAVRRAHAQLELINGYGPTENTTFTICHRIEREYEQDIPLGRPIASTQVLILDPAGAPVPVGIPGEICAGGDGLARGYLHDAALTASRFVPHPWEASRRLYRTGDRGRWDANGLVEFLGRMDDQVKIRGYRIEPAEIEHRLREIEGVNDAVVLASEDADRGREIIAYVTGGVDVDLLRAELKNQLPDYMVPAHFVALERLPLNVNGKLDRRALPKPEREATGPASLPATETERELVRIWQEVLGAARVGATDNFFDIGGHSLKVTKLVALIQQRLGVQVPLAAVFRSPTVRDLARYMLDAATYGVSLADEAMVLLGGTPGAPAVFALPPGTGDVLSYMPLAPLLAPMRVFAFNFIEAESRLADYADLIVQTDPAGPHRLLGYSSGGNLAFHLAAELERRGRRVSDIVMIDSARNVAPYPYLEDEVMKVADAYLNHDTIRPYLATPVLRDKIIRKIVAAYRLLSRTVDDVIVNANIHVVTEAAAKQEWSHDGQLISSIPAWQQVTRGQLHILQGAGGHNEMLFEPALTQNAELILGALSPKP